MNYVQSKNIRMVILNGIGRELFMFIGIGAKSPFNQSHLHIKKILKNKLSILNVWITC
jgi:hypothetical protein